MLNNVVDAVDNFIKGAKNEFLSLEESLTHPKAERKLVDLRREDIEWGWDSGRQQYTVTYQNGEHPQTVFIPEPFTQYIRRYKDQTHYITDHGTPWLTREQKQEGLPREQEKLYYSSLAGGENREVVMVNWSNTALHKSVTGHSSLSIGSLNLAQGYAESDNTPIYEYTPEISGSYYPSIAPIIRSKPEYMRPHIARWKDSNHGSNPLAHSLGVIARDSALPVAAAGASATAVAVAAKMFGLFESKPDKKIDRDQAFKAMSMLMVAYMAGKTTAQFKTSTGTVVMKEEAKGSGLLATLVTPTQMDIMEHALYGIYKTYHEKYNLLGSNCADFSEQMMQEIGIATQNILDEAIETQKSTTDSLLRNARTYLTSPERIRPSRVSELMKDKKEDSRTGEVEIDGQPLSVSLLELNGQSSVLVESTAFTFEGAPIETFQKVLEKGLTLKRSKEDTFSFEFQPNIKRIASTPAASRAR